MRCNSERKRSERDQYLCRFLIVIGKENSGNRAGAVYQLSKEEWCETTYEIFEKSWNTVINTLEVMPPLENDPSLATFLSMNMTKIVWLFNNFFYK